MKILKLANSSDDKTVLEECLQLLNYSGSVLLLPTETVYGLACKWNDKSARKRMCSLKNRDIEKPFQMLTHDLNELVKYGICLSPKVKTLVDEFCPGPITIIVENSEKGTTGFRIPKHTFLLNLLKMCGFPLAATSANISGNLPAKTITAALKDINGKPDLVVDQGEIAGGQASTVVDITGSSFRILRQGPISETQIREALS